MAERKGISVRCVQVLRDKGQISDAVKFGDIELMTNSTQKPVEDRARAAKQARKPK